MKAAKEFYLNMNEFEFMMASGAVIKEINLIKGKIKILKWILEE